MNPKPGATRLPDSQPLLVPPGLSHAHSRAESERFSDYKASRHKGAGNKSEGNRPRHLAVMVVHNAQELLP